MDKSNFSKTQNNSPSIKIFVCHSPNSNNAYIKNDIYQNIIGGAIYDNGVLLKNKDFIGDNTGDNISKENKRFNELTVQYWAWKNTDYDYYGFCHYRRYFIFNDDLNHPKYPYQSDLFLGSLNKRTIKQCLLDDEKTIRNLVSQYDLITVLDTKLGKLGKKYNTLYKFYAQGCEQDIKDFDVAINIIKKMYPNFTSVLNKALKQHTCKFLNMYIMKKNIFRSYCEWLFPILFKLNKNIDYKNSSTYHNRSIGLIAERLFNVYLLYLKTKNKDIKIKCLRNTSFQSTEHYMIEPCFRDKNAIVFLAGDINCKFLAVTLKSIINSSSSNHNYDIIVLIDNMSLFNKNLIKEMLVGKKNFNIRFVNVIDYISGNLQTVNHVNKASYARFTIFDYLKHYNKVIYLDVDLMVLEDINKLFNIDLNGKCVGAVRCSIDNSWSCLSLRGHHNESQRLLKNLNIENYLDYFNAGVMVYDMNACSKAGITTDLLFNLASKLKIVFMDQDILNYVFYKKTFFIKNRWNVLTRDDVENNLMTEYSLPEQRFEEYLKALRNPAIVHYAGHHLPPYNQQVKYYSTFWSIALTTPYFPQLLAESCSPKNIYFKKIFIRRVADKFFPVGSKRRIFLKRMLPKKGSKTYQMLKNIYYKVFK